jgi:hypothetical protein
MVVVVPLRYECSMRVALRLDKNGTLQDALNRLQEMGLPGMDFDENINANTRNTININSRSNSENELNGTEQASESNPNPNPNSSSSSSSPPPPTAKPILVACELVHNRLKAFNSLSRRVDSVHDGETIVFFQVRIQAHSKQERQQMLHELAKSRSIGSNSNGSDNSDSSDSISRSSSGLSLNSRQNEPRRHEPFGGIEPNANVRISPTPTPNPTSIDISGASTAAAERRHPSISMRSTHATRDGLSCALHCTSGA